ncbi:MAG: glucuronate isomerase [Armatimonadota bacterium]|nr:glucuronate isomerase [bacterium]
MALLFTEKNTAIRQTVFDALNSTKITDIHTHLYTPSFGDILLWGIDDLLVYHYLVAEAMRWLDVPYDMFWAMSKRDQADLIWKALFIDHSPISEASRGVLTTLQALGLDTSSRDLDSYRRFFAEWKIEDYVDRVFELANLEGLVMTNDPFDDLERPAWLEFKAVDPRFHAVLRLDTLLNDWPNAVPKLNSWGYTVDLVPGRETYVEIRRFLRDWAGRINAIYMAASLPPTFAYPDDSVRSDLLKNCVFPVAAETGLPMGLMIGSKRAVNPQLKLAGDSVGRGNIEAVEHICQENPNIKFLLTMLGRENQHEVCVAARKFRNLHVFGCWWYVNIPSLIEEITRMRVELLGLGMTPQHSDARVLDQVIYKWSHSRKIIGDVLTEKYTDLAATGWIVSEAEIRRDIAGLLGGNFWDFIKR